MLDRKRILTKIDELDSYLNEISQIIPESFQEYQSIEKKRTIHEYATVNDELVYEALQTRLEDFKRFKKEILKALKKF